MTGFFSTLFLGAFYLWGTSALVLEQLPHTTLLLGSSELEVTIAATQATRERGLMQQKTLRTNEGMLFIFPQPKKASFWMKDTPLALSVAYVNKAGEILEIHSLTPFSEKSVSSSSSSIAYALEVAQGWFDAHHILPGDRIENLPLSIAKE